MPNIERPAFDESRGDQPGFRARRARLGRQAGCRRTGLSLWELPPGQAAYPYHYHHAEEELVIVLAGRPTLRTPEGLRELEQGEVLAFPCGEQGAHQLLNRTDRPVRFLAFSNVSDTEVVVYPDSGKLGAYGRAPGGAPQAGELRALFRLGDTVDYYDGERPPEP
jgi:uncharacterized cupin superfamily protein